MQIFPGGLQTGIHETASLEAPEAAMTVAQKPPKPCSTWDYRHHPHTNNCILATRETWANWVTARQDEGKTGCGVGRRCCASLPGLGIVDALKRSGKNEMLC